MTKQLLSKKIMSYFNIMSAFATRRTLGSPLQVIHFVTAKCNFSCKHCFYHEELNKKNNELTLEEIKKMSSNMGPIFFLLIGGGEPFIRQDLPEIIKTYYENNGIQNLSIPTNASLTKKTVADCEKILSECSDLKFSLSLSLDGLHEEHDLVRSHPGSFKKLVETFHEVSKLKEKYPNFCVNILSTITSFNQTKLKEMYSFIKNELKPDIFQINYIRGKPKEAITANVDVKNYEDIHQLVEIDAKRDLESAPLNFKKFKLLVRNRVNKIRYNMIVDTVKTNKYVTPCYAAIYNVVISEEGDVYPCEILNKKMGNVRDYNLDFKKLWNSENAKNVRKFIRETNCFCTHECFMTTNILFNNKYALNLLLGKKSPNNKGIDGNRDGVNAQTTVTENPVNVSLKI